MKGLFLVVGLMGAAPAWACTKLAPRQYLFDTSSDDTTPPSAPLATELLVDRYQRHPSKGPGGCGEPGSVSFAVDAEDDETAPEALGYRFEYVDGALPSRMSIEPDKIVLSSESGRVGLGWDDGLSLNQEPFDFTFLVYAVDQAGNESEPTEVRALDPGFERGCDVSGGAGSFSLAILAGLALRRRPRR